MYTYGIQDQALKWFRSYSTSRVQICKVKQRMSRKRIIKCCAEQGRVSVFADDTNMYSISSQRANIREIIENLNENLEKVHQWLLCDKLTLNNEKPEYMIIGYKNRLTIIIKEQKMSSVELRLNA